MKLSAKYVLVIVAFLVVSYQGAAVSVELDGTSGLRTAKLLASLGESVVGFAQVLSEHARDLPHTRIFDN